MDDRGDLHIRLARSRGARGSRGAAPIVSALCVLIAGCGLQPNVADSQGLSGVVKPKPAPELDGPALTDGTHLDLLSLRGHAVVIDFWASWCGPCRAEQPDLNAMFRKYSARGVDFLGVDFRDDRASGQSFVREFSVPYPSVFDPDSAVVANWEVSAPPEVDVVDAKGQLRGRFLGTLTGVEPLLDSLNAETRPP